MSGHSHWAGIKQKKAVTDAKRASIFTKLAQNITIAAKDGGGNPDANFKLRLAIDQAQAANMPKDNIERAIKRGTGELKGEEIQEVVYEGYGPGNVAMLIKTTTDNKNRTVGEIKAILSKSGGKMVPAGSVSFLFKQVGNIGIEATGDQTAEFELQAIDAGAEDISYSDGLLNVYTAPETLKQVKDGLEKQGIKISGAGLVFVPVQKISIDENTRASYDKLLEKLDDHPDVQEIFDNL